MYAIKSVILTVVVVSALIIHEAESNVSQRCMRRQGSSCPKRRLGQARAVIESRPKTMPSALLRFGKRRQNTLTVAEFNTLHSINKPRRVDFIHDRQQMINEIEDMGSDVNMPPTVEIDDEREGSRVHSLTNSVSHLLNRIRDYFHH